MLTLCDVDFTEQLTLQNVDFAGEEGEEGEIFRGPVASADSCVDLSETLT